MLINIQHLKKEQDIDKMILPKIFLVFFSICFIFHSLYNVYENILQAKTVDYTYSVNLTDIEFPFNFRITLIPGK